MNLWNYMLVHRASQKATEVITERATLEGMKTNGSGEVRMVSLYGKVFWANAAFGAVLGGLACFFGQPAAGLVLFLLFFALSVPGLLIQYNNRLTYDKEGFVWRNWFRRSRRYSYEEVTGVYSTPLRVVVELNGKKQLDLDHAWINREDFLRAVKRYRSTKPPKLPQPVLGMTEDEITQSYDNGALGKALLVPKTALSHFARAKWAHYSICTLSVLCTVFALLCGPAFKEVGPMPGFLSFALPGLLLMAVALGLYFRFPHYFTAREQPSLEVLPSKETRKKHKRCTMVVASLFSVPGCALFFIAQLGGKSQFWPLWMAALAAVVMLLVLLLLFRRFSWEYRNFGVGYVSFACWQVLFCVSIFFALGGLLVF